MPPCRKYLQAPYLLPHLAISRRGAWGTPLSGMLGRKAFESSPPKKRQRWVVETIFFAQTISPSLADTDFHCPPPVRAP
jgi:hypothetical protein